MKSVYLGFAVMDGLTRRQFIATATGLAVSSSVLTLPATGLHQSPLDLGEQLSAQRTSPIRGRQVSDRASLGISEGDCRARHGSSSLAGQKNGRLTHPVAETTVEHCRTHDNVGRMSIAGRLHRDVTERRTQ